MAEISIEDRLCLNVKEAMSEGLLPPGTKLPEELLAEQWGVNRARVRTVLQRLAFEDLVDLKRNRGAFVASPGIKEARDVFEARRVIERVTTEIVTRTILTPQLRALRASMENRERTWLHGNRQQAIASISAFHTSLAALAHNESLASALKTLILRSALILGLYGTPQTFPLASAHYDALLVLIERGESIAAAHAMERCLYALEHGLDLRVAQPREVDLARVIGRMTRAFADH
ncbi:DNA-binding transcriptional regulator, GntR family [Pseudoxanthobacter soli DSM 19599]|uniref:DNA-binding transcriptional regulator, GntR family n=1 Tax=Pseudoxanthobacter soli DSM 19599 TaxID=1123029 RepID=A0A1M7ZLA8_9HYPH|nr:GntR family transcriptional regulator [Pseudoxanthobacter soli]SHO65599.1 DNA-binding transcriptional regulator, GntR family [Pseudoxanthobacter soli DSM 19599]